MIVNKKGLADVFGVTERTITDWEQAGMPIESRPGRGRPNEYDTRKCIEWRVNRVAHGERRLSPRERKDLAQAREAEMRIAEKSGEFLRTEDVEEALASGIAAARAEFMASARRLKKLLDKKYGTDIDLSDISGEHHAALVRLAEHAPEFCADAEAGVGELDAAGESVDD